MTAPTPPLTDEQVAELGAREASCGCCLIVDSVALRALLAEHATPSDPERMFTAAEVIEIANETSDSLGNLYRLDFIDRIRHEAASDLAIVTLRSWAEAMSAHLASHPDHDLSAEDVVGNALMRARLNDATPSDPPQVERPWCYEESCAHRHWRSGSMPTHRRGTSCPTPASADTGQDDWREDFRANLRQNLGYRAWVIEDTMVGHVERILSDRLAAVEEVWANSGPLDHSAGCDSHHGEYPCNCIVRDLRAALATAEQAGTGAQGEAGEDRG